MSERTVQQLFDLTGKTALLTGATGHLGSAFARALAEAGATVVAASRSLERAERAAAALPTPSDQKHFGVELDHMDESSLNAGFDSALKQTGQIDILVNNGNEAVGADLWEVNADDFNRQIQNATGYFLLARRLRDHAVERGGGGSVINLGSMYGQVASYPDAYEGICGASPVGYHCLKGGIIHMTRHLAVYWAKDGIRVNTLSPGPFPSDKVDPAMVSNLNTKSPMGRMGNAEELKGSLILLASQAGSYITGQNLTIDGGWTAW